MSDRSQRALAYRVFSQALELHPTVRLEFVNQECRTDAGLRKHVEALLLIADQDKLVTGELRQLPSEREASLVGRSVGRFRLTERIGDGGMGVVYRAERTDGVQQSVAVKLMSSALAAAAQHRFEREAQLLARLEHPSIARLIDAGIADTRPWIAIEFVRGERIDDYCRARDLAPVDIVKLLILLTDAIAAAHRMLVVHSDIKPANVLVTPEGLPKLVDFGISTALREAGDQQSPTVSVARLFSPNYSAPEQIEGGPLSVATDVFGLGALGYRLLTGIPVHAKAREAVAYLLAVTQNDVELPSRAALAPGGNAAIAKSLRGDLDAIFCKALERSPARRYATAVDMQADLQRFLDRRPVHAHVPSTGYRVGKFLRRNALVTTLGALLILTTLAGGIFSAVAGHRAALARDMAARRGEFLESIIKSADPRGGRRDMSIAELLNSSTAALDGKFSNEPLVEASLLGLITDTYVGLGRYPEALAASVRQLALLRAHGGSPLEMGVALTSHGEVLREQGKWSEAEPIMRDAVRLLRPLHAPTELASSLDLLGIALAHNFHEREAEATYLQEIAIETSGDRSLQQRRSYPYFALEGLLLDLGRYAEALEYGRKALDIARQSLPPDHPDLLAMEAQYASTLVSNRRAAEAEPLLRQVIAAETRVSGEGHKDTLMFQSLLANDLIELHRDAEAATIARAAAQSFATLLGDDNAYTLTAWQNYAVASCNGPLPGDGLAVAERVEAAQRRLLPPTDRSVYSAASAVGTCLLHLGRYAEAEPKLLAAAAGLEAVRGPAFRRTQSTYRSLRDLYIATHRPQEADRFAAKLTP